jgi:hypothetical protein
MTDTMAIDRSQWAERLDAVTRHHEGDEVTIEVLDIGGRSAAWPVLLRHMVQHPVEVSLATVGDEAGLRFADQQGTVTLVTIRTKQR